MKRLILILSILFPILLSAQNYYWYRGNKINLEIGNKEYVIYDSDTTTQSYQIIAKNTDRLDRIVYRTPSYKSPKNSMNDIFITNKFNVKLKHSDDYPILQQMAISYNVEILNDTILPLWHTLQCTRSTQHNALELANIFYETGNFAAAEPEFMGNAQPACVNDTSFSLQWNLKNIGQHGLEYEGIDINFCEAHSITSGNENIVIAVVDWGIDLYHYDLNIYPLSYHTASNSHPSQIHLDHWKKSYHGTACAGIISAIDNNESGIVGISPSCPVMSISFPLQPTTNDMVRAFCHAADNNCSIISCSWSTYEPIEEFDDAIRYAMQNGRSGLGCVVVFASGNENSDFVNSVADYVPEVIVVGSISPNGRRYSGDEGSNCGFLLDVMAPGVDIPTTDVRGDAGYSNADYILRGVTGTSIACPHVAAIAGLILSVNPYLTAKQVADIIESTTQKVGGYSYEYDEAYPNGTWNFEMGYGLVDAYAAVLAAKTKYVQNYTYQRGRMEVGIYPEIIAGYAVTDNKPYGNVILETGSDVTYSATEQIVLKHGFHAKAGSKLHIKVDTPNSALAASLPQQVAARTSFAPTDGANTEEVINNKTENVVDEAIICTSFYTISGQLIQTIVGGQHDAAHLPNGMYILQHRMSNGSVRCEKIANAKK